MEVVMTDIRERVLTVEEAARLYESSNDSIESETGFWRTGAFVLWILAFMAVCFCAGAFLAMAWDATETVQASGVMDGNR